MLDPFVRRLIDPPLHIIAKGLGKLGITPNTLTLMGFLAGLCVIAAIIQQLYYPAALLLLLNRLLDGLDGAVARTNKHPDDFGGVLDITCDFIIYSGVVFAFGVSDPENLFYAAFLIFSFIGPITTFLAYAIVATKHKINTTKRGIKSFYHLGGICEGTETAILLVFICLFPQYFSWAALIFGGLCWLTTAGRLYRAYSDFTQGEPTTSHLSVSESFVNDRQ